MLVGAAIVLPVVLGYTFFVYRVFRGKLQAGHGYEYERRNSKVRKIRHTS